MTRRTRWGLGLLLMATVDLAAQDRPLPRAAPGQVRLDPARLARADSIAAADLPALLSLLVVRRGQLVMERYYHGADASTALNVKSVTKSIQSATVGIAQRLGLIGSLDEPVAAILPDRYARPMPTYRSFSAAIGQMDQARRAITVRHLLTMTSGIGWEEGGLILNAFLVSPDPVQFVVDLPIASPPGTAFNYSTGATHLLSAVIAKKTGVTPREFTEQRLLRPAGIGLAGWDADPQGVNLGGSEILLTAMGLARFGQLYLGRGAIDGVQVVPADWVDASWERHAVVTTQTYRELIPGLDGYGYLWWRREVAGVGWRCALGFGGQFVLVAPALDLVIAGGSALDGRNPGMARQFEGIFRLTDSLVQPAVLDRR